MAFVGITDLRGLLFETGRLSEAALGKRDVIDLTPLLPEEMKARLPVYEEAVRALQRTGVPFLVIGGIAMLEYGRKDITKDIDFFVTKEGARAVLPVLAELGFTTRRTDELWIYHAFKNKESVDLIFEIGKGFLTERGVLLDAEMLARAHPGKLGGTVLPLASPEDVIFTKLVTSWKELRQHDWQHVLMIIRNKPDLDWNYLMLRSRRIPVRFMALLAYAASCEITEGAMPEDLKKTVEREARRTMERIFSRRAA